MTIAIKIENLSKQYRLGLVSTRTLSHDLNRWWQTIVLNKDDPYLKIEEVNDRAMKQNSEYIWALRNINLEVEQGEVLGIIGKNGAGKSTLLKILSKVTAPTTGTIKARGRIASLLEVGTGFHNELTGRENIFLNGAILGMTKIEIQKKFDEIVDFAGVEKFIDTPVKRYSSGMMVRLGFAVAAYLDPEILIVDEVLAVGDAEFQKKAICKMQNISIGEGKTVLFVSHNMHAISQLCRKSVVIDKGEIIKVADTLETVTFYQELTNTNNLRIVSGNRKIKLISLSIRDKNLNEIDSFRSFDEVNFILDYSCQEQIENVSFAVCFNNELNKRVTSLWTSFINKKYKIEKGDFLLTINVPDIHLNPGTYEIILYVESNGIVLERIDNYKRVLVNYSQNYGIVRLPTVDQGVYIESFNANLLNK